jgi:hypothetical protein
MNPTNNQLTPLNPAQLPAAAQQRLAQGKGIAKNLTEGAGAPIDILSIRGKNFRERINGEEIQTPRPQYEYDVVILDGTPGLGKTYYINPYQDGSMAPPDCWSLNGIKPDPQSPAIQSVTCRGCRWNVFGSKIMQDRPGVQSKAKACADSRRLAVMPAYKVAPADGSDPNPMLLRIPATSLASLKTYAQDLERMGIPTNAIVTRLGFDHTVTHPQLTFTAVGMLNDMQFSHIEYLLRVDAQDPLGKYEDERVRRILEAPPPGEDIDPSELAGVQITNRNDAPKAIAQPTGQQWAPSPPQAAQPAPQPIQQAPQSALITLPDGRLYDPVTKSYVEKAEEPEVEPQRPATIIDLPDGKMFDTATNSYWEPPAFLHKDKSVQEPISERAKAPQPGPSNAPAGAAGAPSAGWKPAGGGQAPAQAAGGWKPAANGQVIEGTATEVKEPEAPAEPPVAKKSRKAAPPVAEAAATTAQEAPASLDALLNGLELDKQ